MTFKIAVIKITIKIIEQFVIVFTFQTIEKYAFLMTAIKSITLPSSVTIIGESTFVSCEQLHIIDINNVELVSICFQGLQKCIIDDYSSFQSLTLVYSINK